MCRLVVEAWKACIAVQEAVQERLKRSKLGGKVGIGMSSGV